MLRYGPPLRAVILAASTAALGCAADPLPPSAVRAAIDRDLATLLRETNVALGEVPSIAPSPPALALFERVLGIDTPLARVVHALAGQLPIGPPVFDAPPVIAYLEERVFDDASYDGDGVFRPSAERLCDGATADADAAAACAARLARLDLRIVVTAHGPGPGADPSEGGLAFAVEVGPARDRVLTLSLDRGEPTLVATQLTAQLDLDAVQHALAGLSAADLGLPAMALAGQLGARLDGDTGGGTIRFTVDRALSIQVAGASGDPAGRDGFALSSVESRGIEAAVAQSLQIGFVAAHFGQTAIDVPARADGKRLRLDLAGLDAEVSLADFKLLDLSGIGVGGRPAVLSVDGLPAQTLDIDPDDGHAFDILVQSDEANDALDMLDALPRLDLRMTTDHAVLGDAAPAFDVTRVLLDGRVRTTADPEQLELIRGRFELDTAPAGHGFAATAGQCVIGAPAAPSDAPPSVQWSAGACH